MKMRRVLRVFEDARDSAALPAALDAASEPAFTRRPLVGAIVLHYLNWEATMRCVADLLEQQQIELDIVVVDNASPDDSFEQLRARLGSERRVELLRSRRNGGYARGNNLGARRRLSRGPVDYLLIINNDVRLPERTLIAGLALFAAAHPDAGMIGPRVVTTAGFAQGPYRRPHPLLCCLRYFMPMIPLLHRLCLRLWQPLRRRWGGERNRRCFAVIGACLLLPAAAFARAGMFDEAKFLGAEEYMLAERLRRQGLSSYYVPAVTAVHHHEVSAIRRSGGEQRYLAQGVASMKHYFRRYQRASELSLAWFECAASFYGRTFLPLRAKLPL